MAGPTKVHSALEGVAVVVESLGLAAAESTVEKETSVGPVAEVEGIAAERWEMISKGARHFGSVGETKEQFAVAEGLAPGGRRRARVRRAPQG